MNDIFKLKIDIGSVHIELEGASNCVHAIFSEIRAQGLGKLSIPNYINDNDDNLEIKKEEKELLKDVQLTENKRKSITSENTSELPNINEIVIKDIPQTECEWIIIYALYCSENVTKTFTMEDIRQMYRNTNRYTDSRNKNFATNFKKCVNDNYFSCINDKDFMAGKYNFYGAKGSVINNGNIKVQNGGYAVLLGKNVENNGLIAAKLGKIYLSSGEAFRMDMSGIDLIGVYI